MSYVASGGGTTDASCVGFLDELRAPATTIVRCTIALIKSSLTDQEAAALEIAAGPGGLPASELARRLTRLGHPISPSSVLRHRKGDCRCLRAKASD